MSSAAIVPLPLDPTATAASAPTHLDPLRLLRGREDGARAGRHQSGCIPYGYRRERGMRASPYWRHVHLLEPDPDEADVVRLIFRLYLRHRSLQRVIDALRAAGIRTRRDKPWSRAGLAWILRNDTYLGRVHFGAIRQRGQHPAIVAPIVFYKAAKLMAKNNKKKGPRS